MTTRRTKIVATIGPSSRDPQVLRELLAAGVDVTRINCSHATADSIRSDVARIRRLASEIDRPIAILADLQGPKIRTGKIDPPVSVASGDTLTIVMDSELVGSGNRVGTTWPSMAQDVSVGERILFNDGAMIGTVSAVRGTQEIDVRLEFGGVLTSNKGINLPDTTIQAPALTEKDIADLEVALAAGVDYVALSFVRSARDIALLREHLARLGSPQTGVIAKIEKPQGCDAIDEILDVVDGIMVARGDLGVEIPLEQVPVAQKMLIDAANQKGRLVITATQMLDSMERNPRPTRAETTDVANAIIDGTDAVMLSGETANGQHPVEAVRVMDRIAQEVERSRWLRRPNLALLAVFQAPEALVARAACEAVRANPRPLVVFTWTGNTALLASKSRPQAPIFALTPSQTVRDRLAMAWGVTALVVPDIASTDALVLAGERVLLAHKCCAEGEQVVVLAGDSPLKAAAHMMKVEVIDGR